MNTKALSGTAKKLVLTFIFSMFLLLFVHATAWAAPAKVTGLYQTDADYSSVTIRWNDVLPDYYEVQTSSDKANWSDSTRIYEPTASISGLSSGKIYYVRVRACEQGYDSYGFSSTTYSPWSDLLPVITAPGSKTTKLTGTNATADSLSFKWNTVSGANGYQIKYHRSDNPGAVKTINTSKTSCKLTGLKANTAYRVYVYAYNKNKAYTAVSIYYTETEAKTLPKKVSSFKNTGVANGYAAFSWTKSSSADGYELQITTYSDNKFKKTIKSAKLTSTENTLGGFTIKSKKIKPGSFYTARVRAYVKLAGTNTKKYTAWSTTTFGSAPKKVAASKAGSNVKISWNAVSGATGYEVWVSNRYDRGYQKIATVKSGKKPSYTLKKFNKKKLKKNTNYYVYIKPIRKSGKTTYKTDYSFFKGWMPDYQTSVYF